MTTKGYERMKIIEKKLLKPNTVIFFTMQIINITEHLLFSMDRDGVGVGGWVSE